MTESPAQVAQEESAARSTVRRVFTDAVFAGSDGYASDGIDGEAVELDSVLLICHDRPFQSRPAGRHRRLRENRLAGGAPCVRKEVRSV